MGISTLIADSRSRRDAARLTSEMTVKRAGVRNSAMAAYSELGGSGRNSSPFLGYSQVNTAARQYQHYKDIPYAAIRPIAAKIASLSVHVGKAKKRKEGGGKDGGGFRTKDVVADDLVVKSITSERIEPLDGHPFLDDISDPNPYMTAWANMYCTVVSLYMTGLSHWWMNPDPDDGGVQFWYLPTTWVLPIATEESPFGKFKVRPPWFAGEGWEVPASDMVRFCVPDPANPLSVFAPMQSQAMAVDVDDMVQRAQHTSMRDGPRPQVVLTAGRLPDMPGIPGSGMRPVLTPEQRKQLVAAIKMAYAGPTKYGEPFIIDGLIENITPFGRSPAEMDFLGSSKLTKDRIFHGMGVNPIVTGETENANRASAVVADSYFYALVVNPLAVQMSQTMTNQIGPRYGSGGAAAEKAGSNSGKSGEKLVIWIAPAEAEDPSLTLARFNAVVKIPGIMTKGEARKYANTGVLKIEGKEDDDEAVTAGGGPPVPPGGDQGGAVAGGDVGGEGGKQSPGKQPPGKQPPAAAGKQQPPQATGKQQPPGKQPAKQPVPPKPRKDFDPNQSRTLSGQFADGGRVISADEILQRVKRSPQNADKLDDWEVFARQTGITGDFREWLLPAASLHSLVKGGALQLRSAMAETTIADKYDSGRRNPVIITRNPSGGSDNAPPLLVVDGNHSLAASLRKWAVNPRTDGYDDEVKCLISDEAATWMGLDLQKGGQDPGAHGKAADAIETPEGTIGVDGNGYSAP